jgi:hypothetical protein
MNNGGSGGGRQQGFRPRRERESCARATEEAGCSGLAVTGRHAGRRRILRDFAVALWVEVEQEGEVDMIL